MQRSYHLLADLPSFNRSLLGEGQPPPATDISLIRARSLATTVERAILWPVNGTFLGNCFISPAAAGEKFQSRTNYPTSPEHSPV